jgi:hypothetical protein
MLYRGWTTIGCAVQCTVYSFFYSVCWDTVLAQWFVVIRCTLYVVQVLWCPVHGVRCGLQYVWCGGVQYGSYGVVHDCCSSYRVQKFLYCLWLYRIHELCICQCGTVYDTRSVALCFVYYGMVVSYNF